MRPPTAPMFWDMRVASLESQALEPIKSFEEMRGDTYPEDKAVETVVARLNAIPEYRALFAKAFATENAVTGANLGKALAAFGRSLVANNSPFDRYMRGDRNAMTAGQIEGMRRFERVGCSECHNGPMFSDYKLHVLGVPDNRKLAKSDNGFPDNGKRANPGIENWTRRTRSAPHRCSNLRYTAPYMHSGVFDTLLDVLEFYDDAPENPNVGRRDVDPLVRRLDDPDDEAGAIITFLEALERRFVRQDDSLARAQRSEPGRPIQ